MVAKDVPEGVTVVGVPARQLTKTTAPAAPNANFIAYAVPDHRESDPRERTISALVDEVQSQRARIAALEEQLASAAVSSAATKSTANNVAPRQNNKLGQIVRTTPMMSVPSTYLDNNATAPLREAAMIAMREAMVRQPTHLRYMVTVPHVCGLKMRERRWLDLPDVGQAMLFLPVRTGVQINLCWANINISSQLK